MPTRLRILLSEIGVTSETFPRSDVQRLLPGGTAVVADPPSKGATQSMSPAWDTAGAPKLVVGLPPGDPPLTPDRQQELLGLVDLPLPDRVPVVTW